MCTSIPLVDLSNPDQIQKAMKLAKALEAVGFVYSSNIPGYGVENEDYVLRAIKWFFSLPLEKKIYCALRISGMKIVGECSRDTIQGSIYRIKIWGDRSLSITVNDCRTTYTHRFDVCIVCI